MDNKHGANKMQFALISKRLPATRYFASYSSAKAHAKALGFTPRQYKIEEHPIKEQAK